MQRREVRRLSSTDAGEDRVVDVAVDVDSTEGDVGAAARQELEQTVAEGEGAANNRETLSELGLRINGEQEVVDAHAALTLDFIAGIAGVVARSGGSGIDDDSVLCFNQATFEGRGRAVDGDGGDVGVFDDGGRDFDAAGNDAEGQPAQLRLQKEQLRGGVDVDLVADGGLGGAA